MRKRGIRVRALTFAAILTFVYSGIGTLVDSSQASDADFFDTISTGTTFAGDSSTIDASLADEVDIPIVEFMPVSEAAQEAQTEPDTNRVTFYDWYGTEIDHVDVQQGETVQPPDETPVVDGCEFQFWFDEVSEEVAPYPFGDVVVEENLNLLPHYEVLPPLKSKRAMADDKVNDLILGILGSDATEEVLETSIEELVPEVSAHRQSFEIVGSGILPASDRVEHVLIGDPEIPKAAADSVALPDAEPTLQADMPEEPGIEPEENPADEDTSSDLKIIKAEEPAKVDIGGIQVSNLIAQILETGMVAEPTQAPPAPTIAPVTPEPTAASTATTPQPQETTAPTPTVKPAATEQPEEATPDEETYAEQLDRLINSILESPKPVSPTATPKESKEPVIVSIEELIDNTAPTPAPEPEPTPVVEAVETVPPEPEPTEAPESDLVSGETALPFVDVRYDYEGELTIGTKVTLMAFVHNVADVQNLTFQWQNDASGTYQDVPGATSQVYAFVIDSNNARGWNWRVNVSIGET